MKLINQEANRTQIKNGIPFQYTLIGIGNKEKEKQIINAIWKGASDADII